MITIKRCLELSPNSRLSSHSLSKLVVNYIASVDSISRNCIDSHPPSTTVSIAASKMDVC